MPPRKKAPAKKINPLAGLPLPDALRQFLGLKSQADELTKRQKLLRDRICEEIQRDGYTDEKGSLYIDLDEEIEGFSKVKYQRSVVQSLNEDRAEAFIKGRDLMERCIVMVPEIDQEELLKCHFEGIITQEELDALYDTSESWSFRQVK